MPHRVPDERGHGDLQGRVPLALLRGPAAAPARLRDGLDLLVGPARVAGAGARQLPHARAGRRQDVPGARRDFDPAEDAVLRARDLQGVVVPPCAAERRHARGSSSGPTRSTTTSIRRPPRRPSRSWKTPASRSSSRGSRSAAAGRSTTSACSTRPRRCCARSSTRLRPEIEAGTPLGRPGAELRGRVPRRDDESVPDGRGRQAAQRPIPSS